MAAYLLYYFPNHRPMLEIKILCQEISWVMRNAKHNTLNPFHFELQCMNNPLSNSIYLPYRDWIHVLLVSPTTNSAVQTLHWPCCKKRVLETLQWHHYYYLISSHIAINWLAWNWFAMHPPLQGHSSFSLSVLHSIHTSLFATHCMSAPSNSLYCTEHIHTYLVKIMWPTLHVRMCSVVSKLMLTTLTTRVC